jgi:hypothetical protein
MRNNDYPFITIVDINTQYGFVSAHTFPSIINPFIIDTQESDLEANLCANLVDAIEVQLKLNIKQWSATKTYAIGDKVFFDNSYYIATSVSTNEAPPTNKWELFELMNFWHHYVKKFLISATVKNYFPFLGSNATQFGLEQYNQEGFQPVSDKTRAQILNAITSHSGRYLTKIKTYGKSVNWTFDGVKYECSNECEVVNTKRGLNFRIIGANG